MKPFVSTEQVFGRFFFFFFLKIFRGYIGRRITKSKVNTEFFRYKQYIFYSCFDCYVIIALYKIYETIRFASILKEVSVETKNPTVEAGKPMANQMDNPLQRR